MGEGMEPLTKAMQDKIVANVLKACKNIENLNRTGYTFLYLCSGFIAHYSIIGFADFYSGRSLSEDIIRNRYANMWTNFHPGQENYDYYMSEAEVYKRILKGLGVNA